MASETLLRCETGKHTLGGYAEKMSRLVVFDAVRDAARGIDVHYRIARAVL